MATLDPEKFAKDLVAEVDKAEDSLMQSIERCIAAGKVTESCLERCPLFGPKPDYDETKSRIVERVTGNEAMPTRGVSLKNNLLWEIEGWRSKVDEVQETGCEAGPIGDPHNWGEVDGKPDTGISYSCSQTQRSLKTIE